MVVSGSGITLAKGAEKESLLQEFAERNEELADGRWKEGWHAFCDKMKESYVSVLAKACVPGATETENKHFGHYLDCEAHTDVWRELFPTANMTNER